MSRRDQQRPEARLTARVEEQHDEVGDLIWALTLIATTYDRGALDLIATAVGCELVFTPVSRWVA